MLHHPLRLLRRDHPRTERGASAVEYGLVLAGIAAVITAGVWAYSGAVVPLFDHTCRHIHSNLKDSPEKCG